MSWEEIQLGDYLTVLTDYHANGAYEKLKKNVVLKEEPDYAIMIRTLNFERVDFNDDLIYINENEYDFLAKSKVEPYDIIMNKIANAGSVYLMPDLNKPVSLAMNLFLLRFDDRVNKRFMFYLMKANESYIKTFANGSAAKTITKDAVRKLVFKLPPLPVQKKIAATLSAYDDLIENNLKRIALLEKSARLLYEEWFVRLRFPGYEQAKIVDGVPDEWGKKKLGEAITLNYGKALKESDRVEGHFPVYGSSGVVGSHEKSLVEGPAIIVGRKGNVGSIYWSEKNCWPIDTVYFITSEQSNLHLYFNLQYQPFINSDAAVPGLNRNHAYNLEIVVPSKSILEQFDTLVKPVHQQTLKLQLQNEKLKQARDILLPKLINGEIAV